MIRSFCTLAITLAVFTVVRNISAQELPPDSTNEETNKPQKAVVLIDQNSFRTGETRDFIKELESAGIASSADYERDPLLMDRSMIVMFKVRATEPFANLKQLIEEVQKLGVSKVTV